MVGRQLAKILGGAGLTEEASSPVIFADFILASAPTATG
jgi:hypothetical protein